MRRFFVWIPLSVLVLGVVLGAQATITTADEYAKVMKSNAQAVGALNKALGSSAFADAKVQAATVRQNYVALQAFWVDKKKDDAVAIVKDGLSRLDVLDRALAAAPVDQMAAQAAAKEFAGNTCGACHKLYREGDAQAGYRFKAGVL